MSSGGWECVAWAAGTKASAQTSARSEIRVIWSGNVAPARTLLCRFVVQTAPEVEAGARPVRLPGLGERLEVGRSGRRGQPVGAHGAVAHAQVARRQDVRPVQG